jgi:hypothetical protein
MGPSGLAIRAPDRDFELSFPVFARAPPVPDLCFDPRFPPFDRPRPPDLDRVLELGLPRPFVPVPISFRSSSSRAVAT